MQQQTFIEFASALTNRLGTGFATTYNYTCDRSFLRPGSSETWESMQQSKHTLTGIATNCPFPGLGKDDIALIFRNAMGDLLWFFLSRDEWETYVCGCYGETEGRNRIRACLRQDRQKGKR